MRWRGRRQSSNVDDRRASGAGGGLRLPGGIGRGRMPMRLPRGRAGRGGGIGLGTVVIALVVSWALGIDPAMLLGGGQAPRVAPDGPVASPSNDATSQFVRVVLADTEDTWRRIFREQGEQYRDPILVLFSGQVRSACGFASAASGPFYCPGDDKLYIDLNFYRELASRLDSPGDFAQAYVLAHEVGHHIQNLTGVLPEFNRVRQGMSESEANALSVRVELQADCYAGVWAHNAARQKDFIEPGDIDEGLNAASQIGDDTLQRRSQGYVVPESFNHGTSAQRVRWFRRGFDQGRFDTCDTFNASRI